MNHLDPKAAWIFFINFIIFAILISFIFYLPLVMVLNYAPTDEFLLDSGIFVLAYLLISIILAFVYSRIAFNSYLYQLGDDGFKKESGVIVKHYTTIPYERIQNVDIYRGIFARLFGLSDIQIQTAGQSRPVVAEGRLPAVTQQVAEQLRDELIRRAKGKQGI